jgi:hypothetical protein
MYNDRIDLSLYSEDELQELEEFFGGLSWNVDEDR